MNASKMFKAALVILAISILVGCSDQLTSPQDSLSNNSGGIGTTKFNGSETQDRIAENAFSTTMKLKPGQSYTFNVSNTGLAKFTAIDVVDLSIKPNEDKYAQDCYGISVFGDTKDDIAVSCHSSGFEFKNLTVQNSSSGILGLRISLYGVKFKKSPKGED
jgi:ABC-type phosphate transport system substrate-binding protein